MSESTHDVLNALFEHLGVALAPGGLPIYDEQTAVSGLFVAGSLWRANIILESRQRSVQIVAEIAAHLHR